MSTFTALSCRQDKPSTSTSIPQPTVEAAWVLLAIVHGQGQQLAFNDNGAAPGESQSGIDAYLRYTFTASGTFYIGISNGNNTQYNPVDGSGDTDGGSNSTGNYTLVVQLIPAGGDLDDT